MSHSRHVLLIAFTASLVTFLSAPQSAPAKHGQDMDYGPVVCHSVTFVQPKNKNAPTWKGAVTRAMVVKLPHGHTLCYDVNRLAVAAYWSGGFLDFGKTHYTSYKGSGPPRPAGKLKYKSLVIPAWTVDGKPVEIRPSQLKGYSLYGDRVVLAYEVGGRLVYELADATEDGVIIRTFQVEGGEKPLSTMIASLDGGKASAGGTTAAIVNGRSRVAVAATGDKAKLQGHSGRVYVDIPAS